MAKMDLNDDDEKGNTETIFWSAMDMLSDDDKKLPQASCYSSSRKCICEFTHVCTCKYADEFVCLFIKL